MQKQSRSQRRQQQQPEETKQPQSATEFSLKVSVMDEYQSLARYFQNSDFIDEEQRFEEWVKALDPRTRQSEVSIRAFRHVVYKKIVNKNTKEEEDIRLNKEIREFKISVINLRKLKRKLRTLYSAMLYKQGSQLNLRKIEEYEENLGVEEEDIRMSVIISEFTVKVLPSTRQVSKLELIAMGFKDRKRGKQSCKTNIPMFEHVKVFAHFNRCNCRPGKKSGKCSGFLICPFEFQHPIQTINDLACPGIYSCVGLALSIALFHACIMNNKAYQVRMTTMHKTRLSNYLQFNTMTELQHQPVIDNSQQFTLAIDELMKWTSAHSIESYGVQIESGVSNTNSLMEQLQLKTHLTFFDLFRETIDIIKNIDASAVFDSVALNRAVNRRLVNITSRTEGCTEFFLVYYLSHVLLLSRTSAEFMLNKFVDKFIKVRMKPYKMMPNSTPLSFFSKNTTVQPTQFKQIEDAMHVPHNACLVFDASQKAALEPDFAVYRDYELTRSIAIVDCPDVQDKIHRVQTVRAQHFNTFGLAAFDIETCKETDQNSLRCGDGNQIPYMLSLKGTLYNYETKSMVDVEHIFIQLDEFDNVWNNVCHQFIKFLIDGNHFAKQDERPMNFIFAHNGSKFDFLFILRWLSVYQANTQFNLVGSPDSMKAIQCCGVAFYDSFLLISKSLNQMATEFLGDRKHEGVDIGNVTKEDLTSKQFITEFDGNPSRLQRIRDYCMQDSVLLYRCLHNFLLTQFIQPFKVVTPEQTTYVFGQKAFHMTASSMSISLFTSGFLKYPVGCVQKFLPYERDTYSGGFTCNFRSLSAFGFSFDINSAYPAQMLGKVPLIHRDQSEFQHIEVTMKGPTRIFDRFPDTDLFEVSYNLTLNEETAFIMRTNCKTALIEVATQTKVWMWGVQVNHMMDILQTKSSDNFITIHKAIVYESRSIYKEFIQTVYDERQANKDNPVLNAMYKMLMCGLYGKHGQKDVKSNQMFSSIQDAIDYVGIAKCYLNHLKNDDTQRQNMWLYVVRAMQDAQIVDDQVSFIKSQQPIIYGVELLEPSQQHIGSLVRMASFISAKNRVYLIQSFRQSVSSLTAQYGDGVTYETMRTWFQLVYCDTDSLYIDAHMLISKLIERQQHHDQEFADYVQMCNDNKFITYCRQRSTSNEGLMALQQLFSRVVKASGILLMLERIQVSDPQNPYAYIPFLDQKLLGSFKIEKYILAAAFGAPKQYSVYYTDNVDGQVKNDVKLKGVRHEARSSNPQLIFDQVDMVMKLVEINNQVRQQDFNETLMTPEQVTQIVDMLCEQHKDACNSITLKFDDLVQFRGHKTGVSIYSLVKYISFVMSKRQIVVGPQSQCVESKPHKNNESYTIQRTNLLAITKLLRKRKMLSCKNNMECLKIDGQIATCVYAVKLDNQIQRDFQRLIEDNTAQSSWFYEQTLMQNSCTSLLDKIGNTQKNLFTYVRQNTPVNFKLVQIFMRIIKNKDQLCEAFITAYKDFELVREYIDYTVITTAYTNNLLRGFINPGTDINVVTTTYVDLMLLNMCIAKWVWLNEKSKSECKDEALDQFCGFFTQQKSKDERRKVMTESVINFNLGVVFQVTMFQYTCRVQHQALTLNNLHIGDEEMKFKRIQNAWNYDNDVTNKEQSLTDQKIDIFLGMMPVVAISDYESDDFELD